MKMAIVILTYACSWKCDFCIESAYVDENGVTRNNPHENKQVLPLNVLEEKLVELVAKNVEAVSLMGGEVTELPDEYMISAINLSKKYIKTVHVITNLGRLPDYLQDPSINLDVSFHLEHPNFKKTLNNLILLDRTFSPTIVLTEYVSKYPPEKLARMLIQFKHIANARLSYCLGGSISYKEYLKYYNRMNQYLEKHNWTKDHLFDGPEDSESICDIEPYGRWTTISSNELKPTLGGKIFSSYCECLSYSKDILKPARECYTCIYFINCNKTKYNNCKVGVDDLLFETNR